MTYRADSSSKIQICHDSPQGDKASEARSGRGPIFLDLEQGSSQWLKHRARTIGASEVSSLLGLNPWQSAEELYAFKTGRKQRPKPNARMKRGTLLEPHIRGVFEMSYGFDLSDTQYSVALDGAEFITASLDGYIDELSAVVEFKAPNAKVIEEANSGRVVDYYYCQLQHQMLVMQCERALFVCFDGRWITEPVAVRRDDRYCEIIRERCILFHLMVEANSPFQKAELDLFSLHPYLTSREARFFYEPWHRLLRSTQARAD